MTEAVASVTTAANDKVLLERSPQASRTMHALRYTLDAMRSERAMQNELPAQEAASFAEEIRRQAAIAGPRSETAEEASSTATSKSPPAAAALTVLAGDQPANADPAPQPVDNAPLDILQWARGVGSNGGGAPTSPFDGSAPERVIPPDITRLAEFEQNQIPRDVLDIMRARHLGAEIGNTDGR